jgi:hypothetical protein
LGKISCRRKEEHMRKLRRGGNFWKTEMDGEEWFLDDAHKNVSK